MEIYSFSLLLSGKLHISSSLLNERLTGYSSLGYRSVLSVNGSFSCHSHLACDSIEKSAASLIRTPLYLTSCFYLAAVKILSLSLNFAILIMCLAVGLYGFLLIGTLCAPEPFVTLSLNKLGNFSVINFSNRFCVPCCSSSLSGISIIWILLCFILSCSSLNPSSFLFSLFSFSCFLGVFPTMSPSSLI